MNMLSKQRLPDLIGAAAGAVGLALLAVVAGSGDAIGHSVGALIGGGFAFGVLGCVWKQAMARRADGHRAALHTMAEPSYAAAILAMPPLADATASEFDERERTSFAPVVSLTEAQLDRQRERQVRDRRATLNRA